MTRIIVLLISLFLFSCVDKQQDPNYLKKISQANAAIETAEKQKNAFRSHYTPFIKKFDSLQAKGLLTEPMKTTRDSLTKVWVDLCMQSIRPRLTLDSLKKTAQ